VDKKENIPPLPNPYPLRGDVGWLHKEDKIEKERTVKQKGRQERLEQMEN
jgi:hypothetical protein